MPAESGSSLATVNTMRLRVELVEVVPAVTRVIDVFAGVTLPELHELLQAALGWTDSHLHQFVAGDRRYGVPDDDSWDPEEQDEAAFKLTDLPPRFTYLYDFGDGWAHHVTVLGPGADQPGCVQGSGACPPEDCGGPSGYEQLLKVLADESHPEHLETATWAGVLPDFDLAGTDGLVRLTAGVVPSSVRLILEMTAGGVMLTPGGRLPRAFVQAVQRARPGWHPDRGPARSEDDVHPLAKLRQVLRKAGLLRLSSGVIGPTKIARSDVEVIRRLRRWFANDQFIDILAGNAVASVVAFGPQSSTNLANRVMPTLGRWAVDGRPITARDVVHQLAALQPLLIGLDQVDADWQTWAAGPSARSLLVRATALAAYWGTSSDAEGGA